MVAARVSAYASITQRRSSKLAPSSRWMSGRATFTTVMSKRSMNAAIETAISVFHLAAMLFTSDVSFGRPTSRPRFWVGGSSIKRQSANASCSVAS